ncbi:simple sugar transport system permease protein [Paenibacillus uliginis N3/975]|uniref:Simple sugar transport system permease protein n=1 Tax=Paenibacillus uliginis N3/975 TaxID=1313296 RepID=A0A1X7HNW6_9BACL|nr:ABC transporter permease [Paenibacillus uliginis]SMF89663.1 simple sugar transport system permease protein [Paenibacillus uliginis N3/975]
MWSSIWMQFADLTIIYVLLRAMTPILLASLGGLISDITGVTNIGLEGLMLVSAFTSIAVGSATGSWAIGVVSGVLACVLISYAMGFFHLKMKVDIIITGFAINIFGSGVTVFLMSKLFNVTGSYNPTELSKIPNVNIPFIENIPVLGKLLSGHNLMSWIALLSVVFCFYLLYRTPYGVHLRAIGEAPESAKSLGIPVRRLQYSAFAWSGVFVGLAGAFMSMGMTSMFVKDMTAGTGFLALAVVLLGNRNPIGILIGAFIFGFSKAIETMLQTIPNSPIPSQFVQVLPYVVTIIALVIFAIRKQRKGESMTIGNT